jgi:hypothetical protein
MDKVLVTAAAIVLVIAIAAAAYILAQPRRAETQTPADAPAAEAGEKTPAEACTELCRQRLVEGADFTNGPCLSNSIAPGWVCDIAHRPRQDADNLRENQCPEYGRTANHFVEVGPDCTVVREV